jgi:uncharacterized SAM-binding protein YcdF (DUF218 family)
MLFQAAGKILVLFVYPFTLSLVLLTAGIVCFWKRPRLARWFCIAALLLLVFFGAPPIAGTLLSSLESQYPDPGIAGSPRAEAIVVLGGLIHMPSSQHRNSALLGPSDRLLVALRLYRGGKAPLVLCSGGNFSFFGGGGGMPESRVAGQLLQEWGIPGVAVIVEDRSVNTRQNATFSYKLLQERGIRRILLVTSATHMPRAAAVFRKAGFEVFAAPADFHTGWGGPAGLLQWLPDAGALSSSQIALKEWIGLCVYRLHGWA